jgi:hypothetical protein
MEKSKLPVPDPRNVSSQNLKNHILAIIWGGFGSDATILAAIRARFLQTFS